MTKTNKQLQEILDNINDCVSRYENMPLTGIKEQSEVLRKLTCNLHWLEGERIRAHERYMDVYFKSKEKSNAGREKYAENKVRELYMIRRIMTGAYKVLESLRSTISVYKKEV